MTKIKDFKAVIYNPQKITDISKVTCPPYDVISSEEQQFYYDLDPHNFIRVILPKDAANENKYDSAAGHFEDWLKKRILIQDDNPAIYFYSHEYRLMGEKKTRFGFIALLHLGQDEPSAYGHEHTRIDAKEDRLKLLEKVKANLSPIFVIFADKKRVISRIREKYIQDKQPFIHAANGDGSMHKAWRLDSPEIIESIKKSLDGEDMFIADGHHRYEVACAYRQQTVQRLKTITGQESFNYILAYFTDTKSGGLTILPIHRLVRLNKKLDAPDFRDSLQKYFDLEEVKNKEQFFFLLNKAGRNEHILGMYYQKTCELLRLKNIKIIDEFIKDKPPEYRRLDVCILNNLVLKNALKIDPNDKETVTFSPNEKELTRIVDAGPGHIAFFLNSVKVGQMMSIALSGEKMPPKTTYFYPKVLSGLVIHKHEES